MRKGKYKPTRAIFVDVDNTLLIGGKLNIPLVEWCERHKRDGLTMYLWSARGAEYAKEIANRLGVSKLFDHIIDKPGYIVDDMGVQWPKYINVVHPSQVVSE